MESYKTDFIKFILKKKILSVGSFKLKSGIYSKYFFNFGLFNKGKDLCFLGKIYAKAIIDLKIKFNLIFGPAYKGIPIILSTAIELAKKYKLNIGYCFNRKEKKKHGEQGILVGDKIKGNVLILDDVITTGTSIKESIKIINKYKYAKVNYILVAIDRKENIFDKKSFRYNNISSYKKHLSIFSIITISDIISYLRKNKKQYSDYWNVIID
ncbi:orotate phosphoribosyltransferase [Buchnera aphidicola (Taiwanaphis decaspermi)]|uniref:orotate phosphoribosyltransferase n=1 Tax=Buchnera aphidicola TaxID=9 RepID=UPI0031B82E41